MYMRFILFMLFFIFPLCTAFAEVSLPPNLIKVNPNVKQNCLEYYNYNAELYCTEKAFSLDPIDKNIINYEKIKIPLDDRAWLLAGGAHTDYNFVVQYIPFGDYLNTWSEMVTTEFSPWVGSTIISPRQYFNRIIENITNKGFSPIVTIYKESDDELIAEFQLKPPDTYNQDELQRIIKTNNGFFIIHYAIRSPDMGDPARKKWIEIIKKGTIIPGN